MEVSELKEWLGIEDDHTDDDALLAELIPRGKAIVQTYTGYSYDDAGDVVEYVRGLGTPELFLMLNPTADPTEVLERADVGDAGAAIVAADSGGWVRRGDRLVRKGGVWTLDYEYEVRYAGGYAPGAMPGDVKQAWLGVCAVLYRQRGKEGTKSEHIGGYSHTLTDPGMQEVLALLPRRGVFA